LYILKCFASNCTLEEETSSLLEESALVNEKEKMRNIALKGDGIEEPRGAQRGLSESGSNMAGQHISRN
jgi:hypothetical protein